MEYADLPIIDISKAKTPEGRRELAPVVRDAMRTYGFLIIVNHGVTQVEVLLLNDSFHECGISLTYLFQNDRMMDIADIPFSQVSESEKASFTGKIREVGSYRGYKPRQFWVSFLYGPDYACIPYRCNAPDYRQRRPRPDRTL